MVQLIYLYIHIYIWRWTPAPCIEVDNASMYSGGHRLHIFIRFEAVDTASMYREGDPMVGRLDGYRRNLGVQHPELQKNPM